MNLSALVDSLMHDTAAVSLPAFRPELCLCATIVAMLLVRIFAGTRIDAFYVALAGSLAGLWFSQPGVAAVDGRTEIFTGLLVYDSFTLYFRALLLFFAVLFLIFTKLSGIPDREDAPDFYSLFLGGTLGMCLMASANHLLMIFLAVEMASVPSYALAGILKGRRQSSEAALKYAVFGAGAAGVMLYGISLLAGVLGSCHLPTMAAHLATLLASGSSNEVSMVLVLGGLMTAVGLAFKLSAVPFHFWCPDVFEGASAEVDAFLSVASKAAALALLVRVAVGFGYVPPAAAPGASSASNTAALAPVANVPAGRVAAAKAPPASTGIFSVADPAPAIVSAAVPAPVANHPSSAQTAALAPARSFMLLVVSLFAAVTCTFGNLAAYGQTNIKRLLAYSTIAHAGYMLMPVAAGLALTGVNDQAAEIAYAAIPFYAGIYVFMNLGAFAVVAFLRNSLRTEQIDDYAGLVRASPGVVICFSAILFSLVGLPPLAGFAGKYVIFASLVDAMQAPAARNVMLALLIVGGANTAISLFYYLRVVKVMTLDPPSETRVAAGFPMLSLAGAYLVLITLPVLGLGLFWDELNLFARSAASQLLG